MTDVSEVCVINRYVICERCKLFIPDADSLDEHVCEAAAIASEADGEMVVESLVKGYQCDYCHKTFAQVTNKLLESCWSKLVKTGSARCRFVALVSDLLWLLPFLFLFIQQFWAIPRECTV